MDEAFDKAHRLYHDKKYNESFPIFLQLVQDGYQNGTFYGYIAMSYQFGNGVEKNEQQMLYWYEKAYLANERWACYYYGNVLYKKGNYEKALKCYIKGSTSNWAEESALKAAKMFEKGEGTEVDMPKAVYYYRLSAISSRMQYSDAKTALSRLGYSVMTEEYIKTTKKWTAESAYQAGLAYENGDGVEKNLNKAIEMYRESAKHEFGTLEYSDAGRALTRLGCGLLSAEYFRNVQVKTDGQTSEQLFKRGKSLEESHSRDFSKYPEAFAYFQEAAKMGNVDAILRMGEIYAGTPEYPFKDLSKSISFFSQIEDRSSAACYELGGIYKNKNDYQDVDKALHYYKKGSTFGDNDGCPLWVGLLLDERGDYQEALKFFELSANTPPKNQGWAMYKIGEYYENGKGCVMDVQKAIDWYLKSSKTNNAYASDAKKALKRLGINY